MADTDTDDFDFMGIFKEFANICNKLFGLDGVTHTDKDKSEED